MREELKWTGEITKVRCDRNIMVQWYASITVRRKKSNNYKHQPPLCLNDKPRIGVDVGINTLATCSNGDTYDNPRPLKRYERKLARANRRLSTETDKAVRIGIKPRFCCPLSMPVSAISVRTLTTKPHSGLSVKQVLSVLRRSRSPICSRTVNLPRHSRIQHSVAFSSNSNTRQIAAIYR